MGTLYNGWKDYYNQAGDYMSKPQTKIKAAVPPDKGNISKPT